MNGIDLIQAHGKLTETVIDLDALEPLPPAEPREALAQAVWDRAQHLRAVMEAADYYVEAITLDLACAGFPEFVYKPEIEARRCAMLELVEEIEKHARRTCPGAELERRRPTPNSLSAAVAAFGGEAQGLLEALRKLEESTQANLELARTNVSRR